MSLSDAPDDGEAEADARMSGPNALGATLKGLDKRRNERWRQVEADHRGVGSGDARDQAGQERARPGPLAVTRERRVVDRHDDRGRRRPVARRERLIRVEGPASDPIDGRDVRGEDDGDEHDERDRPQDSTISMPS